MASGNTSSHVARLVRIVGYPSIENLLTPCISYEHLVVELGNQAIVTAQWMEDLERRCQNLSTKLLEAKETIHTFTTCYDAKLVVLKQVMAYKIF